MSSWRACSLTALTVAMTLVAALARSRSCARDAPAPPPGRSGYGPAGAAAPLRAAPTPPEVPAGDVAVRLLQRRVVTAGSEPVDGAAVALVRADPAGRVIGGAPVFDLAMPIGTTQTSGDGRFEFSSTGELRLAVVVTKDGFVPAAEFADPDDEEPDDIVLLPATTLTLRVTDAAGRPVAGAEVSHSLRGRWAPAGFVVRTGDDGHVRVPVCDDSEFLVRTAGFATAQHTPEPGGPDEETVVLAEGRRVAGVVVDGNGRGIPGALVTFSGMHGWGEESIRTGAAGSFEFDGAGLDGYRSSDTSLRAELDGWVGTAVPVYPGDTGARLVLRRAATVSGRVVLADRSPVAAATVWWEFRTGSDGSFECEGVAPGRRRLVAVAPSRDDARVVLHGATWIDVPDGGRVDDVVVTLAPDPAESYLRVRVLDAEGQPAKGAVLRAWVAGVEIGYAETYPDGNGILRIEAPPGTLVDVTSTSRGGGAPADATTAAPVRTESGVPRETIRLRDARAPRVRLRLVGPDGAALPFDPRAVDDRVFSSDGTRALRPDESLSWDVHVPGHTAVSGRLRPPHPPQRDLVVRLIPAVRVTARLVGADGAGLAPGDLDSFRVYAESYTSLPDATAAVAETESKSPAATIPVRCSDRPAISPDGALDFASLPPGPARLRVVRDSEAVAVVRFDVPATGEAALGEIRLGAMTTVRGIVTAPDGRGVGGARVILCSDEGAEEWGPICTRDDGTFEVDAVPAVARFAFVQCRGFATMDVPLAGDGKPLRLGLRPAGRARVRTAELRDPGSREIRFRVAGTPRPWIGRWAPDDDPRLADEPDASVWDDLPAGPVDVLLSSPGRERVVRVTVVAGSTVDAVFRD